MGIEPGVHISTVCACFLSHTLLIYIWKVHGAISGCTVLWNVHPTSAQNKSLILDTAPVHADGTDPDKDLLDRDTKGVR